jgi:hypothetical protein
MIMRVFSVKSEQEKRKRATYGLMLVLAAWGLLLGLGAYLGIDALTPSHDVRRSLVVVGAVGGFLLMWGVALWLRGRRS